MKEPIQLSHVENLYGDAGVPVAGVSVFGMQAEYSRPSAYIQTGHWPQFSANETPQNIHTPTDAYKASSIGAYIFL